MSVRKILRVGHPLLRKPSQPVPLTEIRSAEVKKLIRDMYDTMEQAAGVGLAAPQIGVQRRVVVVGLDRTDPRRDAERRIERRVLINPEITVLKGKPEGYWEGCLSVPDMRGYVERVRHIRLKWYDEKEEPHEAEIEGFDAVVYQHECDHLDGVLYIDRLKEPTMFGYNDELDLGDLPEV
jgi:peptide deformylase